MRRSIGLFALGFLTLGSATVVSVYRSSDVLGQVTGGSGQAILSVVDVPIENIARVPVPKKGMPLQRFRMRSVNGQTLTLTDFVMEVERLSEYPLLTDWKLFLDTNNDGAGDKDMQWTFAAFNTDGSELMRVKRSSKSAKSISVGKKWVMVELRATADTGEEETGFRVRFPDPDQRDDVPPDYIGVTTGANPLKGIQKNQSTCPREDGQCQIQLTTSDTLWVLQGPVCGDGKKQGGEQCDDANRDDGDGCSAECTVEQDACEPIVCKDGSKHPTCDMERNPINYLLDPCSSGATATYKNAYWTCHDGTEGSGKDKCIDAVAWKKAADTFCEKRCTGTKCGVASFRVGDSCSSGPKSCEPIVCANGNKYPTCDEKGNPINYIQDPCKAEQRAFCAVPCTGAAPAEGTEEYCLKLTDEKACTNATLKEFPYRCEWFTNGKTCGDLPPS